MTSSTTGHPAAPPAAAVGDLRASLRGELVLPADAGYDEHRRVWNGSIDRRPALIARCATPDDVAGAVRFARAHGLQVAVRGGGHSFPGLSVCDDGMLIDLGPMKGIRIDPAARTARAQAGVLLGELDQATQPHGLAVPAGIVSHTGLAGLTLGGGIGWVMRKYGLTIDQLLAVHVVTAEGEFVRASEDENTDLFWGVRGGGGNFGDRHRLRVPAAAGRPRGHGRSGRLAHGRRPAGAAVLPGLDRRLPGRAHDRRHAANGAGTADDARRARRQAA